MDLIDRQRLLAEAQKLNSAITGRDKPFAVAEAFMEVINRQPIVEPRRGKWIHGREIAREWLSEEIARKCLSGGLIHVYEDYHCSECGYTVKNVRWNVDGELVDKYCTFCGADLRETKLE